MKSYFIGFTFKLKVGAPGYEAYIFNYVDTYGSTICRINKEPIEIYKIINKVIPQGGIITELKLIGDYPSELDKQEDFIEYL